MEEASVIMAVIAGITSCLFVEEMEPLMIIAVNSIVREFPNSMMEFALSLLLIDVSSVKEILRKFAEMTESLIIMSVI
jgi:hypothetical protein